MKSKKNRASRDTEDVVQGALRMILRMFRIFGIAPILLTTKDVRSSRALIIYSRVFIVILHILIVIGLTNDMLEEPGRRLRLLSFVDSAVWLVNVSIVMILVSEGTYNAQRRVSSLIRMMQRVNKIKHEIGHNCESFFTKKKTHIALILVMCLICLLLIADFQEFYWSGVNNNRAMVPLYLYAAFYVEYFIVILMEIQLVFLAQIPHSGFKAVNSGLQNLLDDLPKRCKSFHKENSLQEKYFIIPREVPTKLNLIIDSLAIKEKSCFSDGELQSREICLKLRVLSRSYIEMCMMVRNINKNDGPMLLFVLLMLFLDLIINPYYLIMSLLNIMYRTPDLGLEISWCIFHAINTIVVLEPCHKTQYEIEQTHMLVTSLMNHISDDVTITAELDMFLCHLLLNKPSYSPLGMCTISRSFITAIVSAVFTYLVIIIQFQSDEKI